MIRLHFSQYMLRLSFRFLPRSGLPLLPVCFHADYTGGKRNRTGLNRKNRRSYFYSAAGSASGMMIAATPVVQQVTSGNVSAPVKPSAGPSTIPRSGTSCGRFKLSAEPANLGCHSERSEESSPRKELPCHLLLPISPSRLINRLIISPVFSPSIIRCCFMSFNKYP